MARELSPTSAAGTQELASRLTLTSQQVAAAVRLLNNHATHHNWPDHDRHEALAILGLDTNQEDA